MVRKNILIWVGIPIVLSLGVIFAQTYVTRGLQGRLRGPDDDIGNQFAAGKAVNYAPAYLASSYDSASVMREANVAQAPETMPVERKLIKRADLSLEVNNCDEAEAQIRNLISHYSGIVIDAQVQKFPGTPKSGHMSFKVDPKHFDIVLSGLSGIGHLENEQITGEDVTEEYVDLESRLSNYKRVQGRLLKILEENARNVKDILEVERELSRLGEQIERIEGRRKFLDRQVDLSTIMVSYHEPVKAQLHTINFGAQFQTTLRMATERFIAVFNGMIVLIAGLIPIILWIIAIGGIIWLFRKGNRKL